MKATGKNLFYIWLGFGILIGLIAISVSIELLSLPNNLKLSPGEKVTLRVHYPLEFYTKRNLHLPVGSASLDGLLHKRIVLDSKRTDEFDIQLRIFGAIPVKRLHVKFSNPPLVVPGGQAIGVLFSSHGVIIVGHIPVKGIDGKLYYPAKEVGLKVGDIILALNNIPVNRVEDVELILKNYKPGIPGLTLTIKRHNRVNVINIKPVLCMEENYQELRFRLGIFIEDPAAGVGTLTFYDPFTKRFAGLGHHISEFPGAKGLSFQQGEIVYASIHGIKMGAPGEPGEKIGVCSSKSSVIGRIDKNSKFGIFGRLSKDFIDPLAKPIPIAYSSQIKEGQAEIYTVIKGRRVERFKIRIIKVFRQNEPRDKGMVLIVTDPLLLKQTGGIIQGMSGSPIIQDGRLIGAVTHVFVNDPTKGYGVLAEWMNNEINYSIPAHDHHLSPGRQVPFNRIPIKDRGPIMDRVPIKEKAS